MPGVAGIALARPCCAPPVGSVERVPDRAMAEEGNVSLHLLVGGQRRLNRRGGLGGCRRLVAALATGVNDAGHRLHGVGWVIWRPARKSPPGRASRAAAGRGARVACDGYAAGLLSTASAAIARRRSSSSPRARAQCWHQTPVAAGAPHAQSAARLDPAAAARRRPVLLLPARQLEFEVEGQGLNLARVEAPRGRG